MHAAACVVMSETGRSRPGFREDSADQGDVLVYCPAGVFDPDNPEIRALAAARVGAENTGVAVQATFSAT